jgi:hypothetical protein
VCSVGTGDGNGSAMEAIVQTTEHKFLSATEFPLPNILKFAE